MKEERHRVGTIECLTFALREFFNLNSAVQRGNVGHALACPHINSALRSCYSTAAQFTKWVIAVLPLIPSSYWRQLDIPFTQLAHWKPLAGGSRWPI